MVISVHRKPNDMQCYQIHYNFVTNICVSVCWIKYVRIRAKVAVTLVACLISHFMFICSLTRSHWDDIHVTLYLDVCMCMWAQFQLCADRTSFFRVPSFSLDTNILKISNLCWSYSYSAHTRPKKELLHKVYCVPRIICVFLILPLLFSLFHSLRQRNDKFPVFSCDVPAKHECITHCGNVKMC